MRILFDRQHESLSIFNIDRLEPFDRQLRHRRYVNVSAVMVDAPSIPRPSQLWKQLSSDRKLQAADAFWSDENAALEQAEAILAIAQRIKFRAKSVVALPREKKARHLVALGTVSELVAARLLVAYHLAHQRGMMGSFLDALGIKHDAGLIDEEEVAPPPPERLQEAAAAIAAQYPAEDVALYLSTLVWQDPETWGPLAEVPQTRAVA